MKIANIILSSVNGGAEQVMIDYSRIFRDLGHEVTAIIRHDAPYKSELESLGIKVKTVFNKFGYGDFLAIYQIRKILKENDCDIVFSHAPKAASLAHYAIKTVRNKKIFQFALNHGMNVKRSIKADFSLSINRAMFYKTIDLGRNETNSFIVPNAIDLSDQITDSKAVDFANQKTITIGAIARFVEAKGIDYLVRAIKELQNEKQKFVLKLAGSGEEEDNLKQLVKNLGIENEVEFIGWIDDKKSFFQSFDIFCLPSLKEPFGLVILEAMKYQKPVISTKCHGPTEILRHEKDGILFDIEPLESLPNRIAQATLQLSKNNDLANSLIKNATNRLEEKYSFKSLSARLEELLKLIPRN